MRQALAPVTAELAIWRDEGLILPVWWRDDDATKPTPALERLFDLTRRHAAPLHLAVIPEPATAELAAAVSAQADVFALPHGWNHSNYAPGGEKKAEFGAHRPLDTMLAEVARGWQRIETLFDDRALPMLTPPWNRIAPEVVAQLPSIGLRAISTYKPRPARFAAPGLLRVNVHLDPFAKDSHGVLRDPPRLADKVAANLRDRRAGTSDRDEPFGLLTHHIMHEERHWAFFEAVLEMLAESGVARWTPPLSELR